jgi:pyridoxine/pyridoxamine 5'-phosphate oxidase
VSSLSDDGTPQSALVGMAVTPELEIVFDTLQTTRKFHNLVARPRCSLVIGWGEDQTVQYEGIASTPIGPELAAYQRLYFEAWPDGATRLHWPGIAYFVVRPRWIRYSDYNQSPPLIEEVSFPDSA